jgi:DNA-binding PadR family transcriptional regulator
MGGATQERGGRRKRFFVLTVSGKKTLEEVMKLKMQLYSQVPDFSLKLT